MNIDPSVVSAIGVWVCSAALMLGFGAIIFLIDRAIDKKFNIGEEENGY